MCALRCSLQLPLFLPKPLPPPSSAAPLARALSLAQAACAFAGILTSVDVQVSSRGDKNPAVLIAATSLMPLTAPISNMSACGAGFYRASCGAISNDGECVACTTKPLDASYMTAVSTADHSMCAWTCNAGYWRSNNSCVDCNISSCGVGFYRGPCGTSSDAACQACTTKPLNASYTTPGSPWNVDNCSWTCNAGYWRSGSLASCVECSALYWNDGGKRICVKNATLCLEQRVSGISLERASCTDTTPGDCECIVGQV